MVLQIDISTWYILYIYLVPLEITANLYCNCAHLYWAGDLQLQALIIIGVKLELEYPLFHYNEAFQLFLLLNIHN